MVIVHNTMEELVFRYIDKAFQREDSHMCTCERCRMDVAAIALNNLPTKYVATDKGEIYVKIQEMELQYIVDVIREVTMAMEKVKTHPSHK
ncbi:MAG: late competence development ComFB family protein [Gudongella sp.]|nr:late competence development ComFB family protein [Gudongella sp.]